MICKSLDIDAILNFSTEESANETVALGFSVTDAEAFFWRTAMRKFLERVDPDPAAFLMLQAKLHERMANPPLPDWNTGKTA